MLVGKWFGFSREEIFEEALQAHLRGDDETAVEGFEAVLEHRPNDELERTCSFYLAESCARLSRSFAEAGNAEVALPLIEKAIRLAPNYPDYHLAAAGLYRRIGLQGAEAFQVQRSLELHPTYRAAVLYDVARRYRNGDHVGAMRRLEQATTDDPELLSERLCYARQAHARGDMSRALASLEALAERPDNDAQLHIRLGDSYQLGRLFLEAAAEYEKALDLAPNYPDIRCRYAQALMGTGEWLFAARQLLMALRLNPNYLEARRHLKETLAELKMDENTAIALCESVERTSSAEPRARHTA